MYTILHFVKILYQVGAGLIRAFFLSLGCWAPCQDNACRAYLGKALGHNPLGSSGMLEEMVVDETREKAGHICFRKCTIEDLAELRALSSRAFFETFAAQNKPEDMETYLKDAFSEEKMRAELLEPGSTFYFLLVDSELAGYLKLNECGAQTDIHSPDSLEIERIYLDKRFHLILGDKLPRSLIVGLRVRQPVIASGLHEMRVLFILRDLPADLILVLFAELA